MSEILLLTVNTLISFAFIFLTFLRLRKRRTIFLYSVSNIIFVFTNGIGIPFVKYANGDLLLSYGENESLVAFWVNCIFVLFCVITQFSVYESNIFKLYGMKMSSCYKRTPTLFFWVILLLSIMGFFQFFFLSGGSSYMGSILNSSSRYEYYSNRISLGSEISSLPGAIFAFILTTTINPTLMALIIYFDRGKKKIKNLMSRISYWLMIVGLSISSTLISLVFARRFMVIFSLIFPLLLIGMRQLKDEALDISFILGRISRKIAISFVVLISLLIFIFSTASKENFGDSFVSLIERVIVVPPGTNNYYYSIFPDKVPFRGIEKMGKMGSPGSDDVTFQDVGLMAVGRPLTANASFLTVSYSAAGFIGVFCMMFVYTGISIFHDLFFTRADPQLKILLLLTNFYGILMLGSVPLQTVISTFGFITSTFIVLLCVKSKKISPV
jgi:hypothetical protein